MAEIRSALTIPADPDAPDRPDTAGTHVWWLLTRETVGARSLVLNTNELHPRTAHRLHRHPHAEQAVYVVSGSGLHLTETGALPVGAGDAIYVPPGEWHGFANPHSAVCTIVSVYGGIGDRREAGYELHDSPPPIPGIDIDAPAPKGDH
jgi:quercetin dioxygenase-like cupin family protein